QLADRPLRGLPGADPDHGPDADPAASLSDPGATPLEPPGSGRSAGGTAAGVPAAGASGRGVRAGRAGAAEPLAGPGTAAVAGPVGAGLGRGELARCTGSPPSMRSRGGAAGRHGAG